ncbi:hypothetical protein ACWGI0_06565 [Streptomyces sp. NPDC054802]
MAWDEWEQLKAEAVQRQPAQMQLNKAAPVDGGGGTSDRLKSDKKAWVKAGEGTRRLDEPIGTALTKLGDGQAGLGKSAGCESAAAQKELYDSWNRYVKDVRERCKSLGGLLESSGHDLAKTDGTLKGELDAIKAKYQDTEAVGGQAKAR